jgi:3-hydroxyisobutyrate dehydrogenase
MKIAFIGLGNMGGGMAANLVKAGHAVNAFDLSTEALARAKDNGCVTFSNVREAVAEAEAVVSMLPNGKIVERVYADEVVGQTPSNAILLDCSTIDVDTARTVSGSQSGLRHGRCAGFWRDRSGQWRDIDLHGWWPGRCLRAR